MAAATVDVNKVLMEGAAGLAGSTGLLYFIAGVDPVDAATSFSGALGAATGLAAGSYVASMYSTNEYAYLLPYAGAVAVPGLASGIWDQNTLIIGAGAIAGCYAYKMYREKYPSA